MRLLWIVSACVMLSPLAGLAQSPARPPLSAEVQQFVSVSDAVVALTHVQVVDGTGAPATSNQTIVINRGKIATVGSSASVKVPAGAKVLDLPSHTVIPGLVGLHDHIYYFVPPVRTAQGNTSAPRLYLASGVTTIRTTGSFSPYADLRLKRAIDTGEWPGPRIYVTGPYLTGGNTDLDPLLSSMHQVLTPEAARRVVAYWAEEGVSWIKFYMHISRAALKAGIDEAHKRGLKVTAHLCSVTFREAVALGIDNLEHAFVASTDHVPDKQPDVCPSRWLALVADLDLNSPPVRAMFKEIVARRVPITSTLAVLETLVPNRPPVESRVLEALIPDVRTEYLTRRARLTEPGAFTLSPETFRKLQQYEYAFVKAGGLLAAGSDPAHGGAVPGFADQRNYELLLESGFTPIDVIQIMTANGAKVLGAYEQYGSITPGKSADLVVIAGDPIKRPAEIRKVVTVFKEGVGYDSAKLIESVRGLVGSQ